MTVHNIPQVIAPLATIPPFDSHESRDEYFSNPSNLHKLVNGFTIRVNTIDVVTISYWSGESEPQTYNPELWRVTSTETATGSVILGKDGIKMSSGGRTIVVVDAYKDTYLSTKVKYDDLGSFPPKAFKVSPVFTVVFAPVFDTVLPDYQEVQFVTAPGNLSRSFSVRPASVGTLKVSAYAGTTVNDPEIVNTITEIVQTDIGNIVITPLDDALLNLEGDNVLVVFQGVEFYGGIQPELAAPFAGEMPFLADPIPFIEASLSFVTEDPIITTEETTGRTEITNPLTGEKFVIATSTASPEGVVEAENTEFFCFVTSATDIKENGLWQYQNETLGTIGWTQLAGNNKEVCEIAELESHSSYSTFPLLAGVVDQLSFEGVEKIGNGVTLDVLGASTVTKDGCYLFKLSINAESTAGTNTSIFIRILVDGVQTGVTLQITFVTNKDSDTLESGARLDLVVGQVVTFELFSTTNNARLFQVDPVKSGWALSEGEALSISKLVRA